MPSDNPNVAQMPANVNPADANSGKKTKKPKIGGKNKQIKEQVKEDKKVVKATTQNTLLISELRDNMVIMKDGSFRAVIACQSINFDLMSSQEREGIEYSYQNFLNSLNFTVQILIRSQRIDIGPYLDKLSDIRKSQDNMLLNVLMDDYINFIDVLSQEANIMNKEFYVVIPYSSLENVDRLRDQGKNFLKTMFVGDGAPVSKISAPEYARAVEQINNRVDLAQSGLYQIGIMSERLSTRKLGELYYSYNNPDTAIREPLIDFTTVAKMFVRKGEGEAPRPHLSEGGM